MLIVFVVPAAKHPLCFQSPSRLLAYRRSLRSVDHLHAGETGSYRYMAPEVFLHEPYNTKVDVYSFPMICFQLFEGRMPYEGMDAVQAAKNAAMHRQRPMFSMLPTNSNYRDIKLVRPKKDAMRISSFLPSTAVCY